MRFLKTTIFIVLIIIISNCTQLGKGQGVSASKPGSPYTLPAEAYLAMAKNQVGEERESLLILAASRYLQDGQSQEAQGILTQISPISPIQHQQKEILLAKLELQKGQPKLALNKLSKINHLTNLNPDAQVDFHETLAAVYLARGELSQAVHERIKLDKLIQDKTRLTQNRRLLWLHLTKLPEAELNTLGLEATPSSDLKGWMALAILARQSQTDQNKLISELEQWQQRYPNHPANSLLPPSLNHLRQTLYQTPKQIALLLPLSGPLSGPGNAVRDGFMAANQADNSAKTIRAYDTAAEDVVSLYNKAISEGADYIIGPLTKNDAAKIANIDHTVPTLMLNDMNAKIAQNTFKFGLSPTNEARQVALKANQKGLRKALIIAPVGDWGTEIVTAFSSQWERVGGTVVETLRFENDADLSPAVRDFLHVSEKEAQEKQIRKNPGEAIPLAEKRRDDFDMIFLLAYPSKARQIMPLIKYYFAGNIPVYATSTVYAGNTNTMRDRDLDGIIFCDMPWVFANQIPNKNWPEQLNSYNRLYAIGMDSYALSNKLNQLLLFPAMGINNGTGVLYLNRAQRIGRVLSWGKFKGGVAEKVEETS